MASWIKPVLISTGFVATAMHLKVFIPVAVDFSRAPPILFSSFLSWLKPPYLYVITNVIIIIIVGSSRYYRIIAGKDGKDEEVSYSGDNKFHTEQQIVHRADEDVSYNGDNKFQTEQQIVHRAPPRQPEAKVVDLNSNSSLVAAISPSIVKEESEVVTERPAEAAALVKEGKICLVLVPESENPTPIEKPLVTARIGHRKLVKITTAERNSLRALKVAKPKKNETLENTWKLITEGKPTPLTSHYRRPDTFGLGDVNSNETAALKKSETFKDRSKYYLSPAVSRSRDELNLRVDAFIKKCNDERFASMRLDKEVVDHRGLSF